MVHGRIQVGILSVNCLTSLRDKGWIVEFGTSGWAKVSLVVHPGDLPLEKPAKKISRFSTLA
jgi:hypothetical protein